jgi:hypothetical protein
MARGPIPKVINDLLSLSAAIGGYLTPIQIGMPG